MANPIRAARSIFAHQLARMVVSLREKLGAAFAAQVSAIKDSLAARAARARPSDQAFVDRLSVFSGMATG